MLCFPEQQAHATNQKAQKIIRNFRIIMIIELVFALVSILIGNMSGIFYLLQALVIYCAYHALDPCQCVIYECMNLTTVYLDINFLGIILQNDWPAIAGDDYIDQSNLMYLVNLVFSLVVIYPIFQGYREFKGILYDRIAGRLSDGGASLSNHSIDYQMNSVNNIEMENQEPPNLQNDANESRQNINERNLGEEEEEKKENDPEIRNNRDRESPQIGRKENYGDIENPQRGMFHSGSNPIDFQTSQQRENEGQLKEIQGYKENLNSGKTDNLQETEIFMRKNNTKNYHCSLKMFPRIYSTPKNKPNFPETKLLLLKNKEAFDFYPHDRYFIDQNKAHLKNLYKQVKEKHKKLASDPYWTITIMNKVYNEYFMNNPEVLEILKEFHDNKDVEELKITRTQEQIKRIFGLKSLTKKERNLLYGQMLYEFKPEKNYHDLNYCVQLTAYLKKNREKFLKD